MSEYLEQFPGNAQAKEVFDDLQGKVEVVIDELEVLSSYRQMREGHVPFVEVTPGQIRELPSWKHYDWCTMRDVKAHAASGVVLTLLSTVSHYSDEAYSFHANNPDEFPGHYSLEWVLAGAETPNDTALVIVEYGDPTMTQPRAEREDEEEPFGTVELEPWTRLDELGEKDLARLHAVSQGIVDTIGAVEIARTDVPIEEALEEMGRPIARDLASLDRLTTAGIE